MKTPPMTPVSQARFAACLAVAVVSGVGAVVSHLIPPTADPRFGIALLAGSLALYYYEEWKNGRNK